MKAIAILALAFALAGCHHTKPDIEVQTIKVKVKEPCIDKVPTEPDYRFGKGEKPGGREMGRILAEDFEAAEQYGNEWEAAAAGCIIKPSGEPAQ